MRRTLSLVVAVLAAIALAPPAAAATGTLRTLYVQATWGPVPFMQADLERVAAETNAYFQASSSGRLSMPGSITAPIQLPRAAFDVCDAGALRNEASPSLFDGFDRVVFVTPRVATCPFTGKANPTEVLLNGALFRNLAAHELGHTLPLDHASRWGVHGRALHDPGVRERVQRDGRRRRRSERVREVAARLADGTRTSTWQRHTRARADRGTDDEAPGARRHDRGQRVLARVARLPDAVLRRRPGPAAGSRRARGPDDRRRLGVAVPARQSAPRQPRRGHALSRTARASRSSARASSE